MLRYLQKEEVKEQFYQRGCQNLNLKCTDKMTLPILGAAGKKKKWGKVSLQNKLIFRHIMKAHYDTVNLETSI